uniref:Peptidase A2 domain-containing protein n=1 Tax=Strongyloides venezuelensis TaxID=75913 RepID=A0A0K0FRV0_STRVS
MLDQFTIGIRIEDYIYEALVDTGAEVSILPKRAVDMEKMISCNKKIKGYGDGEIISCKTSTEGNLELHMSTVFDLLKRIQQDSLLRYEVSKEGVRISDENKNLFLNRKTPTNKGEWVSLLASSNYFRSSTPNYGNLTAGLVI